MVIAIAMIIMYWCFAHDDGDDDDDDDDGDEDTQIAKEPDSCKLGVFSFMYC